MTNPLLQPDGRFRREGVLDEEGRNRFAESQESAAGVEPSDPLAAPLDATQPAYQPQYAQAYAHRGDFVLTLGAIAFGMCWLLLLAFTDYLLLGITGAAVGAALSLVALVIGFHDLGGMTSGAIDRSGRGKTVLGFRLALSALVLSCGGLIYVVWLLVRGVLELAL